MTYLYQCQSCGHTFEAEQKITDQPLQQCPKCGQQPKRLINQESGFVLNGERWSRDGYG